jgi:hypothetical protein
MATFNINNSKVEQITDSGNNNKATGNGVIANSGDVIQVTGNENKVSTQPKEGWVSQLWKNIKSLWGGA